ncbi:MAG: YfhO family protein [Candidatus Scalindua sp.]|nr:YfhO family protein [Candidatus Scalindua sp.]
MTKKKRRNSFIIEVGAGISGIAILIFLLRSMLIFGETTLMHDGFYWTYPISQFFEESVLNGEFPFWNPYTHGGEPFYPLLAQVRLYEPISLVLIYVMKFVTSDLVMMYVWNHFIKMILMAIGVYIVYRPWTKHLFIRLSLIPILLFSSFMLAPFHQEGIINQFMWVPYITYFLLRIVYYRDYRWYSWLLLSGFIGLNWQSYFFTGTWIFFLFFALGVVFFHRDCLKDLVKSKGLIPKFTVSTIIVLVMMAPNIVLMLEKERFIFPARMMKLVDSRNGAPHAAYLQYEGKPENLVEGINMSYNAITKTGSFATMWDFIQIIAPDGNKHIPWSGRKSWGNSSEAFMYLGLLPWAIAILGMVVGKHALKKVWLFVLIGFGLLMLGPPGGIHMLLYYAYPPMRFVRHTSPLVLFFTFSLIFFFVLGLNHIFLTWRGYVFSEDAKGCVPNRSLARKRNYPSDVGGSHDRSVIEEYSGDNLVITHKAPFWENRDYRNAIAFLLFCFCVPITVYWYTEPAFLSTLYLIVLTLVVVVLAGIFYKCQKTKWQYLSLIVSHISLVLFLTENRMEFICHVLLAFIIPVGIFFFIKTRQYFSKSTKAYSIVILLCIFVFSLTGDLIYTFCKSETLYHSQKHPGLVFEVNTTPSDLIFPEKRLLTPPTIYGNTSQGMRYTSLLVRQHSVFSPMIDEATIIDKFEDALVNKRWNSIYLFREYFELINSEISPSTLESIFAVGKPVFQFKKGVVLVDKENSYDFLNKMGPIKSLQLLENYVLVDSQMYNQNLDKSSVTIRDVEDIEEESGVVSEGGKEDFSYTIEQYGNNSISLKTTTNKTGILYWADGYDKWWRAYVNGSETPVYRANGNFKAIPLPKEENEIRFVYNPLLFKIALSIYYVAFISFVIGGVAMYFLSERSQILQSQNVIAIC